MASVCLMLLLLTVLSIQTLDVAHAQMLGMSPAPPPISFPIITISADGNITPANVPIVKEGNLYLLTGDVTDYYILIDCNNTIFDGQGYIVQSNTDNNPSYSPSVGITVEANNITIENTVICKHTAGIIVSGSQNTIVDCTIIYSENVGFYDGIVLYGNYNNVTSNTLDFSDIFIAGNYNFIERNLLNGPGISILPPASPTAVIPYGSIASFNIIAGNTIQNCPPGLYAVSPSYTLTFSS